MHRTMNHSTRITSIVAQASRSVLTVPGKSQVAITKLAAAHSSIRRSHFTSTAVAAQAPTTSVATAFPTHVSHRDFIHSSSSSSSSSSSQWRRWLLLLGCSSLLVGSAAITNALQFQFDPVNCDSAASNFASTSTSSATPFDPYNPPPPAHDSWRSNWDGLENVPTSIDIKTGRPLIVTHHLLFIRHGQYVLPTHETRDVDPVLTALGREQARQTGVRLKELGYPITTIHVSTMARAQETANLIAESFPGLIPQSTPLLSEGVPCAHVPQHPSWFPSEEDKALDPIRIAKGFEHVVQRWREYEGVQIKSEEQWKEIINNKKQQQQQQQGETRKDGSTEVTTNAATSTSGALHSTGKGTISVNGDASVSTSSLPPLHVDRYSLVVCHGNVIRYSLLRALQLPVQAWLRIAIWNCGISHIIVRSNGHVGLQTLGDTGHLSKEMITYH